MKSKLSILSTCMTLLISYQTVAQDIMPTPTKKQKQVIVQFNESADVDARLALMRPNTKGISLQAMPHITASGKDKHYLNIADGNVTTLKVPAGITTEQFIEKLSGNSHIAYVVKDSPAHVLSVPNDPSFSRQWGFNNVDDHDIDAPEAWDITTGSNDVVVAVIDTGIDYTHPDLKANLWLNPGEIPNDGIDNDGNGYIDDIHGINAYENNTKIMDYYYHGSHMAGIIGAVGNNNLGVTGINHNVRIITCDGFSNGGSGAESSILRCLNYLIDLKKNHNVNIRAINNSYGIGSSVSTLFESTVQQLADLDVLFVAAAANDKSNNDNAPVMPASLEIENVISVASINEYNLFSYDHSNYGLTSVDMAAPGNHILSTSSSEVESPNDDDYSNVYAMVSGTSQATPHVTGAAALALSINPNLSAVELKKMLMETGDKLASLQTKVSSGKRVNLHNLIKAANPTPRLAFKVAASNYVRQSGSSTIELALSNINGFTGSTEIYAIDTTDISISLSLSSASANDNLSLTVQVGSNAALGEHVIELVSNGFAQELIVEVIPGVLSEHSFSQSESVSFSGDNRVVTSNIEVQAGESPLTVYDVLVSTDLYAEELEYVTLTLISPNGTRSLLKKSLNSDGSSHYVHNDMFFDFRGENGAGTWSIEVDYDSYFDNGQINNWSMVLFAAGTTPPITPPTETCTENPKQASCVLECEEDSSQTFCALVCDIDNSHEFCVIENNNELTSGLVKSVTVGAKATKEFFIDVPENAISLVVTTKGNNGDADIFVNYATPKTFGADCNSRSGSSNEECIFDDPQSGTYYITMEAYRAFDNVELMAKFAVKTSCEDDNSCDPVDCDIIPDHAECPLPVNCDVTPDHPECPAIPCEDINTCDGDLLNITVNANDASLYTVEVAAGKTLSITTEGGDGDVDLLVKYNAEPSLWNKDCNSTSFGNAERCEIANTQPGSYFIKLREGSPYQNVILKAVIH